MAIRGVLLDKDGTLLDYGATWVPINREVCLFAARGDVALAEHLLRAGGQDPRTGSVTSGSTLAVGSLEDIAALLGRELGSATPANLLAEIDRIFREGGGRHSVLIDGVVELLDGLAGGGFSLGVASNDTIGGIEASLGRHELLDRFQFLTGSDCGHGAKPEPGMGLAFAAALGLEPAECCMVGDSAHDMEMARRAGFGLRVGVTFGTTPAEELRPDCDVLIERLEHLPGLLGRF
jgi:phosphoglycolate phosphatase